MVLPYKWIESSFLIFGLSAKIPEYGKKTRLKTLKSDLTCLSTMLIKWKKITHLDSRLSKCTKIWGAKIERDWINSAACLLSRGLNFWSRQPCSAAVCRCRQASSLLQLVLAEIHWLCWCLLREYWEIQ